MYVLYVTELYVQLTQINNFLFFCPNEGKYCDTTTMFCVTIIDSENTILFILLPTILHQRSSFPQKFLTSL